MSHAKEQQLVLSRREQDDDIPGDFQPCHTAQGMEDGSVTGQRAGEQRAFSSLTAQGTGACACCRIHRGNKKIKQIIKEVAQLGSSMQ